jgi:hypothetical protein
MCLNPGRRQHEATVAGAAQKTLTHLRCKQHPARVRVEIPQPLRLWERQRQTWHIEIVGADATFEWL